MILAFGYNGQLAKELRALDLPNLCALGRSDADLMQPGAGARVISKYKPSAVINASAFTEVDAAETNRAAAMRLNGEAPGELAEACATLNIPFVHVSTDYVFDGSGSQPWKETDAPAPLGVYGASKRAGEIAVQAVQGPHAILRTSWVFSAHGTNFVKTMLNLGQERNVIHVVADQIGCPTPAADIARACVTVAEELQRAPEKSGVLHFAGSNDVSWADFAREIFARASLTCSVQDIKSSEYPMPAKRPMNSRLGCHGLERFGILRPDWKKGLDSVLKTLGTKL